ncbi:cysteine-rich protein 2-binding protein-like [Porites lutea]|uniref:cysteine-rich protein 2-binding protein-like n=1 Tax=Porites lutea TaxID=51062 RepID=UPI003CC5BD6F
MLQCILCRRLFHVGCLKSGKPSALVGDLFFDLTCANCSVEGSESCTRQNLSWIQAVYLSLYNLYSTSRGRKGYFRWREDICHFIDKNWMVLFPKKKKTNNWASTVAGVLSSGCPQFFKSGQKEFNKETGWWALQENVAPAVKFREQGSMVYKRKRKGGNQASGNRSKISQNIDKGLPLMELTQPTLDDEHKAQSLAVTDSSKSDDLMPQLLTDEDMRELDSLNSESGFDSFSNLLSTSFEDVDSTSFFFTGEEEQADSETKQEDTESVASTVTSDISSKNQQSDSLQTKVKSKPIKTTASTSQSSLFLVSEEKEKDLLLRLNSCPKAVHHDPVARRFRRKLMLRQLKRSKGLKLFDLDESVSEAISSTVRYKLTPDGAVPIENRSTSSNVVEESRVKPLKLQASSVFTSSENVLDRFQASPRMLPSSRPRTCSFLTRLIGGDNQTLYRPITSPYTSRILKPFIRRDYESRPLKLKLLQDIVSHYHRNDPGWKPPPVAPIDYCYVQPHHIPSVNAMCREFFWPGIDLSECLQYPDFSCVVLYKKFVIGFGFMVPDVKYNEAYISFVLVHPEWRRGGIGNYMIYHLIQTCLGKDVTLHVSVTNPAMLMYQKFGFKPEEFICDFYNRYLPDDSPQCRHAFFLRLRR